MTQPGVAGLDLLEASDRVAVQPLGSVQQREQRGAPLRGFEGAADPVGELVAVAEVDEVRRRFPVVDGHLPVDGAGDVAQRDVAEQVLGPGCGGGDVLAQHPAVVGGGAFRAAHDGEQLVAELGGEVGDGLAADGGQPVGVEVAGDGVGVGGAVGEEPQGAQEVPVVVVLGLLGVGERLVRRRGQQQHLRLAVGEQVVGPLAGFAGLVEQMPEALELVQDHQVGLESVDAGPGELAAHPAGQRPDRLPQHRGNVGSAAHLGDEAVELVDESVSACRGGEPAPDRDVDASLEVAFESGHDSGEPVVVGYLPAQQVECGATAPVGEVEEVRQQQQNRAFLGSAGLPAQLERRARCEGDEVHGIGEPAAVFGDARECLASRVSRLATGRCGSPVTSSRAMSCCAMSALEQT